MHDGLRVRPPAVAGQFYPSDPGELEAMVAAYLDEAEEGLVPKALIAPHAGYVYSGPIAGTAYARLRELRGEVERVVVLGPAHRVPVAAMAVPSADAFSTPLGLIAIDSEARSAVLRHAMVTVDDAAHGPEHSIEVHLPFLQVALGDFRLLPIVVGRVDPEIIADVLDLVWTGSETLVVASSDLSHYNGHDRARALDRATAAAIVAGEVDIVVPERACGAFPVRGLMAAAARRRLVCDVVDLRNSGDTAGPRDRVVGYGAFIYG